MRLKLGLAATVITVAPLLVFGVSAPAGADDTTTTTLEAAAVDDTTTTVAPLEELTAPTTSTTSTSTTSTLPGAVTGGASVGSSGGGGAVVPASLPQRSDAQVQLIPPPPNTYGLPGNSGDGRRVVYSKAEQRVWVVDGNGLVIKTHLVSGKQVSCDPPPGTYSVFSRSRYTVALQNPAIVWGYMVRFAHGCRGGNIGFHEIPTDSRTGNKMQTVAQLGQPLSGGCVRQSVPDAVWMWDWAQLGTKVVVLP
jgi:lipoprotein-anchoring transpeptidase ErfK/SrfK